MGQLFSCLGPSEAPEGGPRRRGTRPATPHPSYKELPDASIAATGLESDEEDEFWDAASVGSTASFLSIADLLEDYERYGDVADLDAEVAEAQRTGGHLVPPEVAAAAAAPPSQGHSTLPLLEEVKARLLKEQKHGKTARTAVVCVETDVTGDAEEVGLSNGEVATALASDTQAAEDLARAANLAAMGRIFDAKKILEEVAARWGVEAAALAPHAAALGVDAGAVLADAVTATETLKDLENDSGWMVSRDDSLRVLYRHKKGSTIHSLKFKATFPHTGAHILALAHEWDLLPTWNKFSVEALKLAEPSIFESYVYGAQWMMRPFRQMQAIVRARGFDLGDTHRCLLIAMADADLDAMPPGAAPLPEAYPKRRRCNVHHGSCIKLRPLAPEPDGTPRTAAALMVHLDPHIPYVPGSLINFVLGILAPYVYSQMCKVLARQFADPEGVFPQRVAAQPELYGLVESRLAELDTDLRLEGLESDAEGTSAPASPHYGWWRRGG